MVLVGLQWLLPNLVPLQIHLTNVPTQLQWIGSAEQCDWDQCGPNQKLCSKTLVELDCSSESHPSFSVVVGVYLPLLWEQSFCWKSPIALGYTRGHFSALVAMENDGYGNRGAGANLNTDDDVTVTFLPLVDSERKLLHIHFLSAQEVRNNRIAASLLHSSFWVVASVSMFLQFGEWSGIDSSDVLILLPSSSPEAILKCVFPCIWCLFVGL